MAREWVRGRPRWRLADASIRGKAAMILVPSALAALISVGFVSWAAYGQAAAAGQTRGLFDVGSASAELAQRLQAERAAAAGVLLPGSGVQPDAYEQRIALTDQAVVAFRRSRQGIGDAPAGVVAVLGRVDADLRDLDGQRRRVRGGGQVALSAAAFSYRIAIADLIGYRQAVAQSGVNPQLADEMRVGVALSQAREAVGRQQVAVLQALALGQLTPALSQEIAAARAGRDDAMREFTALARPQWRVLAGRTLTGDEVLAAARLEGTVTSTALYRSINLPGGAAAWSRVMTSQADLLRAVESAVDVDVRAAVSAERVRGLRQAGLQAGVVLAVLVVALLFTVRVAGGLVERLRLLEQGALRVARAGLPDLVGRLRAATDPAPAQALAQQSLASVPVDVSGRDEVGEVAQAFNTVYAAAVAGAGSEAQLRIRSARAITVVARRVQRLSDNVIRDLDVLERDETDSDTLRKLFTVDHHATRLRRYAAGLLVVAGGGPGRPRSEPAPFYDMVRAALSEVEAYERVTVADVVEAAVDPRAVDAVVHILAELLDNATMFSSPELPVIVSAHGSDRDVVITVEDTGGLGVKQDDLQRLNSRLSSPSVDMDVTGQMGMVVIARLAVQYGLQVWVEPNAPCGLVAFVRVPAGLLVPGPTASCGASSVLAATANPAPAAIAPRQRPAGSQALPLPTTGTGWQTGPAGHATATPAVTAPAVPTRPAPGAAVPGRDPTRTVELPRVILPAMPAAAASASDVLPIYEQTCAASPWLAPANVAGGARGTGTRFATNADGAWQAARATERPVTDGTTRTGLPIRKPLAHVIPGRAPGAVVGPRGAGTPVDARRVHAQVQAAMQGLRDAGRHSPTPVPTGIGGLS